jgi:hypothetical protein
MWVEQSDSVALSACGSQRRKILLDADSGDGGFE